MLSVWVELFSISRDRNNAENLWVGIKIMPKVRYSLAADFYYCACHILFATYCNQFYLPTLFDHMVIFFYLVHIDKTNFQNFTVSA